MGLDVLEQRLVHLTVHLQAMGLLKSTNGGAGFGSGVSIRQSGLVAQSVQLFLDFTRQAGAELDYVQGVDLVAHGSGVIGDSLE